jgi:FtsH-binding integral membrane protein
MWRRIKRLSGVSLVLFFACSTIHGDTAEQSGISIFRSDVRVQADATLEVREDITLDSGGHYYRYGFIRHLPIDSEDRWDRKYVGEYKRDNGIRVKILEITRDGESIKYDQGQGYGYSQLRIGEQDVPLPAGEHRYVIRYSVRGALNLDASADTLYWNADGHERDVPIAEAILCVHLPPGANASDSFVEPRVGGRGVSNQRRAETKLEKVDEGGETITYRATHVGPRQSLSIAVSWPSGHVQAPRFSILGADLRLVAVPVALFLFYLIAWLRIGPEPKPGTLVTRYEPPDGLSAAAVRYAMTTGSDGRSFAAVIAALATSGCLRIEPQDAKYKLSRMMSGRATEAKLAPEEKRVLSMLFEDDPIIELTPAMDQRNTAQNTRYVFAIQQELSKGLDGLYFTKHAGVIALGVLATVGAALWLAATAQGRDTSGALYFTMWILFAGLMIGLLFEVAFLPACKTALRSGGWVKLIPGAAAVAVFVGVIVYMLRELADGVSPVFSMMIAALLLVNLAWGPQLKRRTPQGRQILDEIAGFRLFLEKVEKDRLDKLNSANEAPQTLDKNLPYAIALEVREAWGDHLAQTFLSTSVMR